MAVRRLGRGGRPDGAGGTGAVSLRDLAKLVSVDVSTVSRALNGDPRISTERARDIRRVAEKAGYRPRPLRTRRARAVGLLIASADPVRPDDRFLERLAWETERVLGERRLHIHLECVTRDAGSPTALPAIVRDNRVDGVLVAGHPPASLVAALREAGVPTVAVNDAVARLGVSCVRPRPEPAMAEVVLRLAALGHQRFALLMTDLAFPTVRARHEGYLGALKDLGIEPDPKAVLCGLASDMSGGRAGVRSILSAALAPTAIVCCNDWMALGALNELQRRGVDVPGDVSLVGHDDLAFCVDCEPPLTSVRRSEREIVERAIQLLLAEIDRAGGDASPQEAFVEESVVWRDSTGMAPARRAPKKKGARA